MSTLVAAAITPADQLGRLDDKAEAPLARGIMAGRGKDGNTLAASNPGFFPRVAADTFATMIIRNGNASIEVDTLDRGIARLRELATRVGGSVANTSTQSGKNQMHSATLELRIPSARFDEALSGLAPIGHVEGVNISAQDVGEEYVDVAARVMNGRRLEARLIEVLANRTGKLSDVLAIERELARVREEIERYEGRLRYLRTRAATSSLAVTIHEPVPVIAAAAHNPIVGAFREAWRNFVMLVAAVIASLGVVIPLGVVAGAGYLVFRKVRVRWAATAGASAPAA